MDPLTRYGYRLYVADNADFAEAARSGAEFATVEECEVYARWYLRTDDGRTIGKPGTRYCDIHRATLTPTSDGAYRIDWDTTIVKRIGN